MTVYKVELAEPVCTLMHALCDQPLSREGCAQVLGDPVASASPLTVLRDLRFVSYDRDEGEWFPTADGRTAAGRSL